MANNYPYELRLWDFSNSGFDFSKKEIKRIAEYGKSRFTKPNKAAVVASDDLAYGEMRMFQVFREQDTLKAGVFRTKEAAFEWLRKT